MSSRGCKAPRKFIFGAIVLTCNSMLQYSHLKRKGNKTMQYTPEQKAEAAKMIAINERTIARMKTKTRKEAAIAYLEDMNKRLKDETFKIA